MASTYPYTLDTIAPPVWTGSAPAAAIGQTGRTAQSFLTDTTDSIKSVQSNLPKVVVPNVVGNGSTDDRVIIQTVLGNLPSTGKFMVWLRSLCYVGSGGASGGAAIGVVIPRSNVTLAGEPGAGLVSDVTDIRLLSVSGIGLTLPTNPYSTAEWITSLTVLAVAGPIAEGAGSIVMSSSGHGLVAGDEIFIRTGQLVSGGTREPDAELNEVQSVSGATVTLRYPTAKAYVQEYMQADGISATGPLTVTAEPFGVSKVTGKLIRDTTIRGLRLLARGGSVASESVALQVQQAWGVNVIDCDIEFGKYGIASRFSRKVRIRDLDAFTYGASTDGDPAWVGPSTGCSDWKLEGRGAGLVPAKLHCHEGVSDYDVRWRSRTPDGVGQVGASNVSIRARAYRHTYDLDMQGAYTAASTDFVRITSVVGGVAGNVHFKRLRVRGASGRSALNAESVAVTILPGGLDLPVGGDVLLANGADPLAEFITIGPNDMVTAGAGAVLETLNGTLVNPAWLMDPAANEGVAGVLMIPLRWRRWQLEYTVAATTAPVAGTGDTSVWQATISVEGATAAGTAAMPAVHPDATALTKVVFASVTTVGAHGFRAFRVATSGSDNYAADARLRAVRARRLA